MSSTSSSTSMGVSGGIGTNTSSSSTSSLNNKRGTRLSGRRRDDRNVGNNSNNNNNNVNITGEGDSIGKDDKIFHDNIVRRTNELFVKLNITTTPIQAFEELQKSASSMFVAIFETLFNVRLKNVIRKPRVVTDYITNAQLVMTALQESLGIDLSLLSGEAIYQGDPIQIHHMLSIFESLWASYELQQQQQQEVSQQQQQQQQQQTFDETSMQQQQQTFEDKISSSPPKVSKRGKSPTPQQQRSSTPFPGQYSQHHTDGNFVGSENAFGEGGGSHDQEHGGVKKRIVKKKKVKKTDKPKAVVVKSTLTSNKTKIQNNSEKEKQLKQRRKKLHEKQQINNENARDLQNRIAKRRNQEKSLAHTTGSLKLQKGVEKLEQQDMYDTARKNVTLDSLRVLAHEYPSIYQTIQRKMIGIEKNRKPRNSHIFANRISKDLERYEKAYNMLSKSYEADARKRVLQNKKLAQMAEKSEKLDRRVEDAKTARMEEDLKTLEQSRLMERKSKEELMIHSLFSNALKLETEWLLEKKKQEEQERELLDNERINRFESIQRYYLDREEMLKEKIEQESRDKKIENQARRIALRQIENNLRSDYRNRLDRLADEWEERENRQLLKNEEYLASVFEKIQSKLSKT